MFFVNYKLKSITGRDEQFGRLTDLALNRDTKEISLEMTQYEEITCITIEGYRFDNRKGETYLCWDKVNSEGPAQDKYSKIFDNINGIELSKRYMLLVEAIL